MEQFAKRTPRRFDPGEIWRTPSSVQEGETALCRQSLSLSLTPSPAHQRCSESSELILISVHPHVAAKELSLENHKCSETFLLFIRFLFSLEMLLSALTGIRKVLLAHKKNLFKKHPSIKLYKYVLPSFILAEYSYINKKRE